MAYHRRLSFRLQDRDINILCFILKHQFVTLEHIQHKFWNNNQTTTAATRVNKLADKNFIDKFNTYMNPAFAYCLTQKGREVLAGNGIDLHKFKKFHPYKFKHANFEHLKRITTTAIILENMPQIQNLRTEAESRLFYAKAAIEKKEGKGPRKVPDLIFDITGQDQEKVRVAVEVELIYKSKIRYLEILKLYEQSNISLIFYICEPQTVLSRIKRWCHSKRFYFALWSDFLAKGIDCPFLGKENATLAISDVINHISKKDSS